MVERNSLKIDRGSVVNFDCKAPAFTCVYLL